MLEFIYMSIIYTVTTTSKLKGVFDMSNRNRIEVPEAKTALDKMKTEVANELGVDLTSENLTAKDAGKVGGQIVKRLIEKAEQNM